MAVDPLLHGLADLLDDRLPGGRPRSLALLRTKYKPSRKLTAYYEISFGGGNAGKRHIAVSWFVQPIPGHPQITLLVSPADPTMPQLARLTQPRHLAVLVAELTGRPVEGADKTSLDTIRYRPGQRHVLYARFGQGRAGVYVKVDRDTSGARAVPVAELLAETLTLRCPDARVAEPIGYSRDDSAALWCEAAGEPLSRLLIARTTGLTRMVERVGRALRAWHDTPSSTGSHPALARIGSHDVRAEAVSTLRAGEHIAALLPSAGRSCDALVSDVVEGLGRLPADEATFSHGDFKSDNLLVHDDALRILDLDRTCWADPAMDLGKFLADLRWWCPAEEEAAALGGAFRAGYGACDPARWARADLLSVLFQVKFAARRCAVHDARWPTQVRTQVAGAAAALAQARAV